MIGIGWATLYHSIIEKYNKQVQQNYNIQQNNVNK
jgi:hypothetical protein